MVLPKPLMTAGSGHDLVLEDVPLVGEDGGDAGVDVLAVADGDVTHGDAGDVGDEIALAGGAFADLETGFFVETHDEMFLS